MPRFTEQDGCIDWFRSNLSNYRVMDPGTMEALKWLAVILMTLDHANRHLLHFAHPWMYNAGRLAFPLFVFVLAYNLARPTAVGGTVAIRVLQRLLPFAVISSLPYAELNMAGIGPLPLNVLFTLAAGTAIVALIECPTKWRTLLAVFLFVSIGWIVDYQWNGLGLFIACWHFFRRPNLFWGAAMAMLLALLVQTNENYWALASVLVIAVSFAYRLPVKRIKGALYYYYPLHLYVLAVLKIAVFDN